MTRAQGRIEALMRERVAAHPDAVWLKWLDERVTWREALSNCLRAANGLLELGVRPGDRVALMMANRPEFIWTHLGIQFIGGYSVPVNISQRGVTLEHILADSDATTIVFQNDLRDVVLSARNRVPALKHLVVADGMVGDGVDATLDRLLSAADSEPSIDLAETTGGVGMLYTSGTTGPPKGVVATGYDLTPLFAVLAAAEIQAGETVYTGLPLFHANALLVSMLGSMFVDAQLALAPKFSASRFFDDARRHEAVSFTTLGGMISILMKQPPRPDDRDHNVRVALSAGCPPDLWEPFQERFGVRLIEWFGMVDSPGILLNNDGVVGSMGLSGVAGVEFRVVDDEDNTLPADEIGELVFRHPAGRLTHYHKLPEATEHAYRGGWFHSGDLAVVDAGGYFHYKGRKKESMRRLGENVSAWEIETVLNAHPQVVDSAAHPVPSELGEDEIKACVIARPGSGITPAQLHEYCRDRMARYAVPRYVEFLDSLPKTATERNQYAVLRARGLTPNTWDSQA
ncbi:MAG TPA: AMP-binding protein [Sporichthyaceae bacterium]|nr:AMP-binding protein [Sporichthyaceae bacterium]